jgi:uncharacterized RDD family membrane protein YckC
MNAIAQPSAASMSGSKLDNRRMLAALIDLAVVGAGAAAILVAAGVLGGDGAALGAPLAAVVIGWGLYYYFACESGGGQTLGKKLMNLRVVRVDGSPAAMREVAVRTVLRVVDTVMVGLIAMLASGERRARVGDLAARTMIVSTEANAASVPAAVASGAPAAPVAEEPVLADPVVTPLVEEDVAMTAPEAPPVPELRPFEPFAEPAPAAEPVADAAETDLAVAWLSVEDAPAEDDEPVLDEAVVDEPLASEPVVELSVVRDPVVELSVVEAPPLEEVVAEEPLASVEGHTLDVATQSMKELVDDVAAARGSAPDEVEPVVEADDSDVTVRSVETVSAIDHIMGDDEPAQDSPAGDDPAPDAPLR